MKSIMKSPLAIAGLLLSSVLSVNASSYTPEAMLSAPRRGAALPNEAGTLAVYSSTTYNFTTHKRSYGTYVINLADGTSTLFTNSSAASDVNWLGSGNQIVWFVGEDDGTTSVYTGDATTPNAKPTSAGTIPGPVSGLKLTELSKDTWGIAFSGTAAPNGTLYNSELAATPHSSGRAYTSLFVRHWDTYITPERNSIWYATLKQSSYGKYSISKPVNALAGTKLESPVPPFGGTDHYDINKYGLVFIAKDPTLNQARTTKSDVYYVPLKTFTESAPKPKIVTTKGLQGASAGVVFSPVSPSVAFVRQKGISYESDKNRVILVKDVTKSLDGEELYATQDGKGGWDRSPEGIFWSQDGKSLYLQTEDYARVRLFSVAADSKVTKAPSLIFKDGAVSSVAALKSSKLLVTSASFVDNSIYSWVDPKVAASSNATSGIKLISANLKNGARYGISSSQISEIWYKGEGNYNVQAWVIKPSNFDPKKTYPLAFYIHGGPQGSTADTWSTRWNLLVYAEQGYVVVAFNPTGSTGFGQWLTDHIQNQWGGAPYQDLVKGYEYIAKNLHYVDLDRAIALGASYGGYMVNWIQGNDLGRKFKALFTHDGSFNTLSQYSSEELWFMEHDFNGTLWQNWDNYARWNPAQHTDKWATPHLIVHNELDYRLPIAEGLSAFNVLQSKGVESKFLSFPDENHWVLKPENSLVWHKTVLDWLNTHVGLPAYSQKDDVEFRATLQNGPWI